MDLTWLIGAIGFSALVPVLAALFVIQFWNRFALMPFMIGVLVEAICAVMTGMYWIAALLVLSFISSLGYAISTWEAEPIEEEVDTVEILPWLADSKAYQTSLIAWDNPGPRRGTGWNVGGRHRQKYIRHRGDEKVSRPN